MEKIKVGVVSLGCDKNRVDTENMLAYLAEAGYEFTTDPYEADVIIVNTCAFIESAKKESINTIFEMAEYKNESKCRYLIVTGCLSQRYMESLVEEMPEVDAFLGTSNYDKIVEVLDSLINKGARIAIKNGKDERNFTSKRYLSTPYHYSYLKIAEGCNNRCTYCAIPAIRGKYTSRPMEALIDEAKSLIDDYGIKELNIVAQDVTQYGIDIYNKHMLLDLVEELSKLDITWLRLLYCYPELINDDFIKMVSQNEKVCKYLDIPLQHSSDRILRLMNRHVNNKDIRALFDNIRTIDSDISIRSTFIVGFPGETEEDFANLKNFVSEYKIDRCGFFAYSKEDGTPAFRLPGHLPESVKNARLKELYAIQNGIMEEKAKAKIGREMRVLYESIDYDRQLFVARSEYDAPDIDANVFIRSDKPLDVGNFYDVRIVDTDNIDLIGEVLK